MSSVMKKLMFFLGILFAVVFGAVVLLQMRQRKEEISRSYGKWNLLIQYEPETFFTVGKKTYAKTEKEDWYTCRIILDDQIVRPKELTFSFTCDMAHSVVAIDAHNRIVCSWEFGEGIHWEKIPKKADALFFNVHSTEIEQFHPIGRGEYHQASTPYTGKYFSVLGDSISTYYRYIPLENRNYYDASVLPVQAMWWQVLAKKTGMIPCVINAFSGAGVTELFDTEQSGYPTAGNSERCEKLNLKGQNPDEIFVVLGGNDVLRGVDLDVLEKEYLEMVQRIRKKYPDASIHACSYYPLGGGAEDAIASFNVMIQSVAEKNGLHYIDSASCGISSEQPEKYFVDVDQNGSGIHMNELGHELFGSYIAEQLLS